MSESITAEDKEQYPQKPPSSVGRIACEIVAGTAMRFAIAVPALYVTVYVVVCAIWGEAENLSLRGILAAGFIFLPLPMFYGPASSVAVCLVGSRGNETGLFLTSLGVGLLGLSVMVLLYPYICTAECVMLGIEKTVLWLLVFLAAPILAKLAQHIHNVREGLPRENSK